VELEWPEALDVESPVEKNKTAIATALRSAGIWCFNGRVLNPSAFIKRYYIATTCSNSRMNEQPQDVTSAIMEYNIAALGR
jgi:hypothetical protein